jgi:hypothetical protein
MNFKVFTSVNIHAVALSWSRREREHPAPAARSMLRSVWDTLSIMLRTLSMCSRPSDVKVEKWKNTSSDS